MLVTDENSDRTLLLKEESKIVLYFVFTNRLAPERFTIFILSFL